MKKFKKLASVLMALTLTFGFCGVMASCGGDDKPDTSSQQPQNAYTFTVLNKDGSAAADVKVQLCDPATGVCLTNMPVTDENGKATFTADKATTYDIHLWNLDTSVEYTVEGAQQTPATFGEVTVTVGEPKKAAQ